MKGLLSNGQQLDNFCHDPRLSKGYDEPMPLRAGRISPRPVSREMSALAGIITKSTNERENLKWEN